MAQLSSSTVVASCRWLAHRYDERSDAIQFVAIDRPERASATFLTDEHISAREPVALPRSEAVAHARAEVPPHFIFHSAFCCSTLLAAALDHPGSATCYREPQILNDIVGFRRRGAPHAAVAAALDAALVLLARTFEAGETAVIKPSNICNGLIPAALKLKPTSRALLLYAPLPVFLTSVAKKGLDGRLWVRELFLSLRDEGLVQELGFSDREFFGQTDLQIAAVGWLAQQSLFARLANGDETAARVRSLDSESLVARSGEVLAALSEFFLLSLDRDAIAGIVEAAFNRNPKTGKAFGEVERAREHRAAGSAHRDEIEKVAVWAAAVADAAGIPMTLGAPLL